MPRYRIELTPSATRALGAASPAVRQDVTQLVQGLAELATMYSPESSLWARLGRVVGDGVEIPVSGHAVRVALAPAERTLTVVSVDPRRTHSARTVRSGGKRALPAAVMAPALSRRRRARAELHS